MALFLLILSPAIRSQDLRPGIYSEDKRAAATVSVRNLSIPRKALENYQQGVHELLNQNPAKSIPYFLKAIGKYPDYYEAYHNLGIAQERLGQEDQAMDSFQKAIDTSRGKYALAEYAYALMLCKKGKAKDAEPTIRYALELGQYRATGEVVFGAVLLSLHRGDEAERHVREALSLDANLLDAYLVLAGAHEQNGDYAAEVQDLDTFLHREPPGPRAQVVRTIRNEAEGLAVRTLADSGPQNATISSNP